MWPQAAAEKLWAEVFGGVQSCAGSDSLQGSAARVGPPKPEPHPLWQSCSTIGLPLFCCAASISVRYLLISHRA